jgi:hypothetical protein
MDKIILEKLIEESIRLELNVATLYRVFSEHLEEDVDFWWDLHLEERSHATLLRAAKDSFIKRGLFPEKMIARSLTDLANANKRITAEIERCRNTTFSRTEACKLAITLENEVGESHYEFFMGKEADSSIESVFQQLNREDKDHEGRIRDHLQRIESAALKTTKLH